MIEVTTKVEFEEALKESCGSLIFVHITRDHEPSQQIMDVVEMLKSDLDFTFVVCDQVSPNLTTHLAVTEVPTVVVFKDKVETGRIVGPQIQELVKLVHDTASGVYDTDVANSKMTAAERKKDLFSSLQELVYSQPVLLFMKGNKAHPFCKFSRGAIDILNSIKDLPYATFDILKNSEVREGLKEFGDWPTYPQLYAEGELIGGVDIMRQMSEAGTLDAVLWEAVEKQKGQRIVDLRKLVRKAPVMLFMKGNPQQPFCGFSRKMVEILGMCGVDYDYFDILSDDEVRAGLKELFEWPTYPQLYSNGSLVGGLDVVEQLVDNGGPARLKEELEAVAQEADDLPPNDFNEDIRAWVDDFGLSLHVSEQNVALPRDQFDISGSLSQIRLRISESWMLSHFLFVPGTEWLHSSRTVSPRASSNGHNLILPRDTGGADNPLNYLPLNTGKIQFKLKTAASVLMLMSLLWLLSTSLLHADVIRFRDEPWFRKSHALSYHDLKGRTRSGLDKRAKSAYSAVVPPPLDILRTVKESSVIEKVEHLESVGQKLVEENAPLDYESLNEFQIYFFVLSLAHIGAAFTTFLVIRRQFRILHEYVTLMCFYCTKASLWRLAPKLESTDLSRLFVAANLNFDCLPPLEDPLDVAAVNEKILSHSGPRVLTKEEDDFDWGSLPSMYRDVSQNLRMSFRAFCDYVEATKSEVPISACFNPNRDRLQLLARLRALLAAFVGRCIKRDEERFFVRALYIPLILYTLAMLALAAYPLVWVYSWSMPPMKPPTFNAIHQVPFDSEHGWTGSVFIITGSLLQLTVSMYAVFLSSTKMMASFLLTPSILHSQCSASDRFILNWTGPTYFESIRRAVELFTGELLQEMWLRLVGGPVACRLLGSVTSTSQSRREPRLEALIDRLLGTVSSPLASQSRDDTTECRLRESSLSRGDMNERLLDRPTRSHADVKEAIRERRASTSTNKQAGESTSNSQSDIECAVRSASASSSDLKAIKGHLKEIDEILTAELGDPTNPLDNASTRELLEILCKREAASRRPS